MSELDKKEKQENEPQRTKNVKVRIVKHLGKSAIVEWVDKGCLKRVTVPADKLDVDKVTASVLSAGHAYGVPWENIEFQKPSSKEIANSLRKEGIWTYDDIARDPRKAMAILQSYYRVDVGALIMLASEFKGK